MYPNYGLGFARTEVLVYAESIGWKSDSDCLCSQISSVDYLQEVREQQQLKPHNVLAMAYAKNSKPLTLLQIWINTFRFFPPEQYSNNTNQDGNKKDRKYMRYLYSS